MEEKNTIEIFVPDNIILENTYDQKISKWSTVSHRNNISNLLKILGINGYLSKEGFQKMGENLNKYITEDSSTHLFVDPVGLGTNGEKITKIMSDMCRIEEAQSIITNVSDKIVDEMLNNENIEPKLVCVFQRKDYVWDFYLYFFTCEKKRSFKKKDITLNFVHEGGNLHNKLILNDLIKLSNFLENRN